MADRAHYRKVEKCLCGRELRSKEEREYGECHRCQKENGDSFGDMTLDLEMRSDDRRDER